MGCIVSDAMMKFLAAFHVASWTPPLAAILVCWATSSIHRAAILCTTSVFPAPRPTSTRPPKPMTEQVELNTMKKKNLFYFLNRRSMQEMSSGRPKFMH